MDDEQPAKEPYVNVEYANNIINTWREAISETEKELETAKEQNDQAKVAELISQLERWNRFMENERGG